MTQTWPLFKSPPQSDSGCCPWGGPPKTYSFHTECGVQGATNTKNSMGTSLSVTFVLASPWHCFMYLNRQPCPHPSPASLLSVLVPYLQSKPFQFLSLVSLHVGIHSLTWQISTSFQKALSKAVQLPRKSQNPLPLISHLIPEHLAFRLPGQAPQKLLKTLL